MRRAAGLLALATGLLVVAPPAWAEAPEKTAWFNALSAGPLAVPAPTQDEGDLRVAGSGTNPTAYTTLLLRSTGSSGELVLKVADGSAVGTPELALCPTRSPSWEPGGNQPFSEGPEYDCSMNAAQGELSSDGTTVTFSLDSGLLPAPGTVSLAVVPLPEGSAPFQVDLREPAFTPGQEAAAEEPAAPAEEPAQEPAGGSGTAEAPPLAPDSGPVEEPVAPVDDAPAPELAGVEAAPLEPGTEAAEAAPALEPEVVLEQAPATAVEPVSQVAVGERDIADGPRVLALLTLIAVSAGAGYAAGQQRPTPRIIGGRARALPAGGAAGGALAVVDPAPAPLERGIGRFSRLRDAAPRRLR